MPKDLHKCRWIIENEQFTSCSFFFDIWNLNSGFRIVLFLFFSRPRPTACFDESKSCPLSCFAKVKVTVWILSSNGDIGDFSRIITPIVESNSSLVVRVFDNILVVGTTFPFVVKCHLRLKCRTVLGSAKLSSSSSSGMDRR